MRNLIALLSVGLTFIAFGCGTETETPGETGALSLELVVGSDIQINEVAWEIANVGLDYEESGAIDVSRDTGSASIELFGLPPGPGYIMTMTASSVDGKVSCSGSTPFDVEVGVVAEVQSYINCLRPTALGGVRANGEFNVCAQLTSMSAYPMYVVIGEEMELEASAVDDEGDLIEYLWTATGGTVADVSAPATSYVCDTAGDQFITIQVSDDGFEACIRGWTVGVVCN